MVQGVPGSLGQWLVILAHRHISASTLAPLFYTQLLWSTFGADLVLAALQDLWTVFGMVIIFVSGL